MTSSAGEANFSQPHTHMMGISMAYYSLVFYYAKTIASFGVFICGPLPDLARCGVSSSRHQSVLPISPLFSLTILPLVVDV